MQLSSVKKHRIEPVYVRRSNLLGDSKYDRGKQSFMCPHQGAPIRVIYVMGAGRSGSTMMNIALGNHDCIDSFGELNQLPQSGWINNEYDSSGKPCNEVPFWNEVRAIWMRESGVETIREYVERQNRFGRFRRLPHLLRQRWRSSPEFQVYARQTRALFAAICQVSGKSTIVDASKSPTRAFALSLIPGIELYLIHLVRDTRGVVWSYRKSFVKDVEAGIQRDMASRPIWRTALNWIFFNLQSAWVCRQLPSDRSIRVRYEDFAVQPDVVLDRIGQMTGCDFNGVSAAIQAKCSLPVGHVIAGNRLRMQNRVQLRLDEKWRHEMPARDQRLTWLIAGWLMRHYDYR